MYCHWQSPDGKHTVNIRWTVLEQLRNRVTEAFLSLPGRGAEVGGILYGHADEDRVSVDEVREISCEHRFGPSFVLSTTDREALKATLAGKQDLQVVGAYRSYARRPAALDDADQQLFRTFFPDARHTFLLFEPHSALECRLSFLCFIDGELPSESPFPAIDLRAFLADKPQEERPATPAPAFPPAAPVFNLPPAHRRREREQTPPPAEPRRPKRVLLPLIACIVLSIGAALIYELWQMASAPHWSDLKLDARRQPGGDLELSWDAGNPAAVLASRGILMVTDGGVRKNLELSPEQVRGGNLTYKPIHPDVLFRLQLYGSGMRAAGDSLRVLTTAGPQPAPPPQTATVRPSPPPVPAAKPAPVTPTRSQSDRSTSDRTEPSERLVAATAPEPVHQVQPQISAGIRSRIESRMVVSIQVKVNKSGRVVEAISPAEGTGLYRFLADESLRAARQWRFTPAKTAHGKPVDGRKTIDFVFTPSDTH